MSNNGKSDDTRHGLILTVNLTNDGHVCESAFRESQLRFSRQATLRVGSPIPQTGTPDWIKRRKQSKMIAYGLRAFAILSKDLSSVPRPVWDGPTPSNSSSKESDAPLVSLDMALLGTCLCVCVFIHTHRVTLKIKTLEGKGMRTPALISPAS